MTDKGTFDQVKGKVKETAGEVTGNEKLKSEGFVDKVAGKAKEVATDAKDMAEGLVDGVKDKFDKK